MNLRLIVGLLMMAGLTHSTPTARAEENPCGKGMTEANTERLVLDDMKDVSDWYNGSPEETTISASDKHLRDGTPSLLFANVVDHTKGEKNYPIGWPRTGKNLNKSGPSDWSAYDFFECWIYVETSRESLPATPIGLGIRHSGHKRGSDFALKELKKDAWTKISIPIKKLQDPKDVQAIQFHISESNYKHGDRIDFFIAAPVLARFVEPAVAELATDRTILYSTDRQLTALYALVGSHGMTEARVEFEIGQGSTAAAKATAPAARQGELSLGVAKPLAAGVYWARLGVRDGAGKLLDRKQVEFRVVAGPY